MLAVRHVLARIGEHRRFLDQIAEPAEGITQA